MYGKSELEKKFRPLSKKCSEIPSGNISDWASSSAPVVRIPTIGEIYPRPDFLPPAIPRDLSERIIRLHGNPHLWWISQMVRYILRATSKTESYWRKKMERLKIENPFVGIQVRRTDKLNGEASFHPVSEYMKHVEEYFERIELKEGKPLEVKRVFVASDDPQVLKQCRSEYPEFTFIGDEVSMLKSLLCLPCSN
jgi:glycoprotein 6-alpha-L-fucosyltransferase